MSATKRGPTPPIHRPRDPERLRRTLLLPVAALALAAAAGTASGADVPCDEHRPGRVFTELEAIDERGEARLKSALGALSAQEGWSQSDWEKFTLGLSDNPRTDAMEARRDELMTQIFVLIARPPLDCERLDVLEAEVLEIERRQWEYAVEEVEQRLGRDPVLKPL